MCSGGVNSSAGRVQKNGTTYALATSGKPPYTEKSWTTPGTYTFTVPQGVTRVRAAVCGGGGGGASAAHGAGAQQAGDGGTSSVGNLITASGGGGGYGIITSSWGEGTFKVGRGGNPNGVAGSTQGFALSFTKGVGSYGVGGSSYKNRSIGGSGGYASNYVNVKNGETITIKVGVGGIRKCGNTALEEYTTNGTHGFVLIAYGGDI